MQVSEEIAFLIFFRVKKNKNSKNKFNVFLLLPALKASVKG